MTRITAEAAEQVRGAQRCCAPKRIAQVSYSAHWAGRRRGRREGGRSARCGDARAQAARHWQSQAQAKHVRRDSRARKQGKQQRVLAQGGRGMQRHMLQLCARRRAGRAGGAHLQQSVTRGRRLSIAARSSSLGCSRRNGPSATAPTSRKEVSDRQRSGVHTLGQWAGGAEQMVRACARVCVHAMR